MTKKEQQRLLDEGHTLVGADGVKKKILEGSWRQGIGRCLGFRNTSGTWFYGAGLFPEDEEITVE